MSKVTTGMRLAKTRRFSGKQYLWEDEASDSPAANKKAEKLRKKGWNVRIVKGGTASKWNPNKRTLYIRKK